MVDHGDGLGQNRKDGLANADSTEPIKPSCREMHSMSEPLDSDGYADFIRRIREGDEAAAEELVKLYEREIRLEIRTRLRLRNPNLQRVFDSADVCQSVLASFFVRAAIGEFDLEEPRQLIHLLIGMARNKLAEQVRFHQRRRRDVRRVDGSEAGDILANPADETPSQVVAIRELFEAVRERLSEEELKVAELRCQGLPWEAVAAALGGTPEGRRKQLSRAITRVEQEMGMNAPDH